MQTIVHMQVTREVLAHHRVCSDEEYEMAVSVSPPPPDQFDLDRYMLYVYTKTTVILVCKKYEGLVNVHPDV